MTEKQGLRERLVNDPLNIHRNPRERFHEESVGPGTRSQGLVAEEFGIGRSTIHELVTSRLEEPHP